MAYNLYNLWEFLEFISEKKDLTEKELRHLCSKYNIRYKRAFSELKWRKHPFYLKLFCEKIQENREKHIFINKKKYKELMKRKLSFNIEDKIDKINLRYKEEYTKKFIQLMEEVDNSLLVQINKEYGVLENGL